MAGANSIRAGRAFVELSVKDSLAGGLNKAAAQLKVFGASVGAIGKKMTTLGLSIAAPLALATKLFTNVGGDLLDLSQRTGMSVEALGELGFAAEQSGSNIEELEAGIRGMQKSIGEGDK